MVPELVEDAAVRTAVCIGQRRTGKPAVMLPLGVAALKKDPAIVAQPILTTIVDVVSLLVYLGIALGASKAFGLF